MKAWSNIQISPQDQEIVKINNLEKKLGELPDTIHKIRELITRFKVCHFKYQQHLRRIKDSIINLEPSVETTKIGINHIRHGENVLNKDTTGRKEFQDLNGMLKSLIITGKSNKHELIKAWLIACLAKTIKENVNLSILITDIEN